jgi:hypothetical protein
MHRTLPAIRPFENCRRREEIMKQTVLDDLVDAVMSWAYPEGPDQVDDNFTVVNRATIRSDILRVLSRHKIKIAPQHNAEADEQQATQSVRQPEEPASARA